MYYAPHILQKRIIAEEKSDEFGRPIPEEAGETWVEVCRCRCDHNGDKEVKMPDGTVVTPDYHVVLEGNAPDVEVGDYVRCLKADGTIRGEGRVIKPRTLNYLPYAEIYL